MRWLRKRLYLLIKVKHILLTHLNKNLYYYWLNNWKLPIYANKSASYLKKVRSVTVCHYRMVKDGNTLSIIYQMLGFVNFEFKRMSNEMTGRKWFNGSHSGRYFFCWSIKILPRQRLHTRTSINTHTCCPGPKYVSAILVSTYKFLLSKLIILLFLYLLQR